jgi:hypothetical protein
MTQCYEKLVNYHSTEIISTQLFQGLNTVSIKQHVLDTNAGTQLS